jgi:two-component system cell cycle response regulator
MSTVLHVDNSNLYKTILREKFTEFGWRYLAASGVSEAMSIIEGSDVDLIVTALELEDGGGEELVQAVNAGKHGEIPIVIITSSESMEVRRKLFSLGAIDFIPKNIPPEQLREYIEKLIKRDAVLDGMKDLSIAVLDDSEVDLKYVRSILEFHGLHNVHYFKNPDDLLGKDAPYDIYLVDVVLPKYSGDQVVYQIRNRHRNSVIIAVSGIDHFKTIAGILLSGADDYIMKPFNESVFMARLKSGVRPLLLLREVERKNAELEKMIITDGLTKLYNHQHLYDQLDNEVKKAKRYGRALSIIMFDIDDFKKVNDSYGHQVGDTVLVKIARELRESVRDVDMVGRYGGEEFLVILPETGLENAHLLADRIRQKISALKYGLDSKITISGGVAELREDDDVQDIVGSADKLLYRAKQAGKNRVEKFN